MHMMKKQTGALKSAPVKINKQTQMKKNIILEAKVDKIFSRNC